MIDEHIVKVMRLDNADGNISDRKVCMFWYIDSNEGIKTYKDRLLIKTVKLSEFSHPHKRSVMTYPETHIRTWSSWVQEFRIAFERGHEVKNYRYYPRGRVSYLRDYEYQNVRYFGVFELVIDTCLIKNNSLIEQILLQHCGLSKSLDNIVVVNETEVNEEHYICHNCGNAQRE